MAEPIIVSVCVFTFNYEKYLAQALDSILNQQTNFAFEVIIGDDCSTDKTREIAKHYQDKHPGLIKLSFNPENIGGTRNWLNTIYKAHGKYIALLDGDDYFVDKYKLQKQVDLMEMDNGCVLCFHAVDEVYDDVAGMDQTVRFEKKIYRLKDFLSRGWFIRTGSTMFRNGLFPEPMPTWVYDFPYRFDTIMHVFLGMRGHALYIDEVMSVWRKHQKGLSRQLMADTVKNVHTEIAMATKLNEFTDGQENQAFKKYCAKQYSGLLLYLTRNGRWLKHLRLLPRLIIRSDWTEIRNRLKSRLNK